MSVWPESSRWERSNFFRAKSPSVRKCHGKVVMAVEEHSRCAHLPGPVRHRRQGGLLVGPAQAAAVNVRIAATRSKAGLGGAVGGGYAGWDDG